MDLVPRNAGWGFRNSGIWELKYESFPYLNPSIPNPDKPELRNCELRN